MYRGTVNLADELRSWAGYGDGALILAPQGMEYIVGYLGALEANLIAVPLSAPMHPSGDERISAVLTHAELSVILTTSALVDDVMRCVAGAATPPVIIELDRIDLDALRRPERRREMRPDVAYLQYTSGSTRSPKRARTRWPAAAGNSGPAHSRSDRCWCRSAEIRIGGRDADVGPPAPDRVRRRSRHG